jgi:hypothetical protein
MLDMPGTNTVALVSVVVAGTSAVVAPGLAGLLDLRRERWRTRRDRKVGDLVDLRVLLDEMAVAFEEARLAVRRIRRLLGGNDPGGATAVRAAWEGFASEGQRITRLRARTMVRLGAEHAVVVRSDAAVRAMRQLSNCFERSIDRSPTAVPWTRLDELEQQLIDASDAYVDAAVDVVGSELGA